MRSLMVVAMLGILLSPASARQQGESQTDPYSINLVKTALSMRRQGLIDAKVNTYLRRMGDRTSIALIKCLGQKDITDPLIVRTFLTLIRDSFSEPQLIVVEADKQPAVTMLLLRWLRDTIADTETQQEVQNTMDFVTSKTNQRTAPSI